MFLLPHCTFIHLKSLSSTENFDELPKQINHISTWNSYGKRIYGYLSQEMILSPKHCIYYRIGSTSNSAYSKKKNGSQSMRTFRTWIAWKPPMTNDDLMQIKLWMRTFVQWMMRRKKNHRIIHDDNHKNGFFLVCCSQAFAGIMRTLVVALSHTVMQLDLCESFARHLDDSIKASGRERNEKRYIILGHSFFLKVKKNYVKSMRAFVRCMSSGKVCMCVCVCRHRQMKMVDPRLRKIREYFSPQNACTIE